MKIPKYIIFVLLLLCLHVGVITYATYCSYNQYGNYHCTYDDGSYAYWNDQSNGNPYSGLPYYSSEGNGQGNYYIQEYYYTIEEPKTEQQIQNEKCQKKYPGTYYRKSDGWCACLFDPDGVSTWDDTFKRCLTQDELDARCDKKYPGTIYAKYEGICVCGHDTGNGSSRTEENHCERNIVKNSNIIGKEKSSWNFLRQVLKVEIGIIIVVCLLGGYGIFIIWFLLGIPMIISGILVGLGIIDENNIAIIGLINVIWFWGSLVYGPKFMESLPSKNDKKVT